MKFSAWFCMIPFCISGASCWASDWHYNGYINQSIINTTDNNFFGPSDDGLNDQFRELALIVRGQVLPRVEFAAQLLSRKAGTTDNGNPRIDYGFFTWHFDESMYRTQNLSLGRVKIPYGFYNETRDSPFSRNCIFLPQSAYSDRVRNSVMVADELLYSAEFLSDEWIFGVKAGYGYTTPDKSELIDISDITFEPVGFEFRSVPKWNWLASADYGGGRFRFAFSRIVVPVDYSGGFKITPTFIYHTSGVVSNFMNVYSFEWNEALFSVTIETHSSKTVYGEGYLIPADPDFRESPGGDFYQFKVHVSPKIDLVARYETSYFTQDDKDGSYFASKTGLNASARFAYDRALGVTYRPTDAWLLMAEFHKVNGNMWSTYRDTPKGETLKRHWDIAAISAAWRF